MEGDSGEGAMQGDRWAVEGEANTLQCITLTNPTSPMCHSKLHGSQWAMGTASALSPPSILSPLSTTCPPAPWGQLSPPSVFLHVWLLEAVEEGAGACVCGERRGNEPPDFTAADA